MEQGHGHSHGHDHGDGRPHAHPHGRSQDAGARLGDGPAAAAHDAAPALADVEAEKAHFRKVLRAFAEYPTVSVRDEDELPAARRRVRPGHGRGAKCDAPSFVLVGRTVAVAALLSLSGPFS
jgi:hypothetical protein